MNNQQDFHRERRQRILKKYPAIKKLYGYDAASKYYGLALGLLQLVLGFCLREADILLVIFCAYVFGGFITQGLNIIIHDACHNLLAKNSGNNKLLSILINLPIGIPMAIAFRKYHLEHHKYTCVENLDVDLPSKLELKLFKNRLMKAVWMFFFPFFYSLRPIITQPKKIDSWETFNIILQLCFMATLIYCFGYIFSLYLLLSTFFGMSIHPAAAHFITEHYTFKEGQETFSYYGLMNIIQFNFGYHVEHHDFPLVPWSKLPQIQKIAPEFYHNLFMHRSYIKALLTFLFSQRVGVHSRVRKFIRGKVNLKKLKIQS